MKDYKNNQNRRWESKNGKWVVRDNDYCHTIFTIAIENEESCNTQYAIVYHDGTIAYDTPEAIPKYVKKQVERLLNPCIGLVAYKSVTMGTVLYTMYKAFKYHHEALNQTYKGYIMHQKEFDRVVKKGSWHGMKLIEVIETIEE